MVLSSSAASDHINSELIFPPYWIYGMGTKTVVKDRILKSLSATDKWCTVNDVILALSEGADVNGIPSLSREGMDHLKPAVNELVLDGKLEVTLDEDGAELYRYKRA